MSMREQTRNKLRSLLQRRRVVELPELYEALGTESRMTVFRRRRELGYRTSYSHRGRYYTLTDLPEFDDWGLWFYRGIGFSQAGTLKETATVQVEKASDGCTHGELSHLLRVRVHNTLLDLIREGRIGRETYRGSHLYVSAESGRAAEQIRRRLEGGRAVGGIPLEPTVEETIEILGDALRGAAELPSPLDVVRGLAARGVSVPPRHVKQVYEVHGLTPGKKTDPPT